MYASHSNFQKLRVCAVGASYPPEFYSWIENKRLRFLFEKIAIETEEDYQSLIKSLESFGITTIRTKSVSSLDEFDTYFAPGKRIPGPISMVPRDELCMIGDKLYVFNLMDRLIAKQTTGLLSRYEVKSYSKDYYERFGKDDLPDNAVLALGHKIKGSRDYDLVEEVHRKAINKIDCFSPIIDHVRANGNKIVSKQDIEVLDRLYPNGIIRLGKDLYFGVDDHMISKDSLLPLLQYFPERRIKFIKSNGHLDGTICPAKPGLLLSVEDVEDHQTNFKGWDIVYLKNQAWHMVEGWNSLKIKNAGKWWIPGHEQDDELISFVTKWMQDWVGYVEETVFDVNALVIDEKNILVSGYNKQAFDAFEQHGMTPHIIPWRHRFFWDGGLHCITLDLDREGQCEDYIANPIDKI